MRLADEFMQQIPSQSVTLFDKGFWSADLLLSLSTAGESRHWLISTRKGLVSEEVARYGKGDRLLRMKLRLLTVPRPSPRCIRSAGRSNWAFGISRALYNRMQ